MKKIQEKAYFKDEDGALYCNKCGAQEGQCDHVPTLMPKYKAGVYLASLLIWVWVL